MAVGHMNIRAHSRRKHHSVAAAFAYRLGCALVDRRTGQLHDYNRRGTRAEVVAGGFACGKTRPAWALTAQAFADALETAEKRWDAMVCRDVTTALPHELDHEQRIELAAEWAEFLATKYNAPVPWAVHRPDARSDNRNWHIHSLLPTRTLDETTGELGAKLRQFHVRGKRSEEDLSEKNRETKRADSGGANEIRELRREWERRCNQALVAAGLEERISMGRLDDPTKAAPVLSRGEVEAERKAWRERHPRTPQPSMSVSQLVSENASAADGCATERGRQLARYLADRPILAPMHGLGARVQPAGGSLLDADEQRQDIESAATTAETIRPVDAPAPMPAPERTRTRKRRRRRRAVRAVEVAAAATAQRPPERRPEEVRTAVALAEASQLLVPTPIPAPERTQSTHSAVCAAEPTALPTATPIALPERSTEPHSAVAAVEPPPAPQRLPERRPEARSAVVLAEAPQLPASTPIPTPERTQSARSAVRVAEPPALSTPRPISFPEQRIEVHSAIAKVEPPPAPQRPPERRPKPRTAVALVKAPQLPIPKRPRPPQRRTNAWSIVRAAETVRILVPTAITRRLAEIAHVLRNLAAQRTRFLSTPRSAARQEDEMNSISEIERVRRRRAGIVQAHAATHGVAPGQDELSQAREWLTRRKKGGQHGTSIPAVADSVARQRLTGNPVLSEFHPERYSERPSLPTAISELAPRAAPGFHGDRFGPIPDAWNTGACRTRNGAEQAANVLERAIDDIARQHFDGRTDPRDYEPGWFKPSVEKAKEAAIQAWQALRETTIDRMVTVAAGPEAIEIRRRLQQENTDKQAREQTAQKRRAQLVTVTSRPTKPDHGENRWD